MAGVQLNDLYCECDNEEGLGQLDTNTGKYLCFRCGKEVQE